MPTHIGNCYEILSQIRYGLNEFSSAKVQGTDTTGAFQNEEILRQINNSQYYLWSILVEQFPEYFMKVGQSLSFVASVATLPSDCFKIREILDTDGYPIFPINYDNRHIASETGSKFRYYRYGNTIRVDQDSITETGSISYVSRCRELDTGAASATNTLATTAKAIANYYNDMMFENITDSTVDTITAYTAARVVTATASLTSGDYYGIVSDLPAIFHPLISEYAILQLKKNPKCPLAVTVADVQLFSQMLQSSLKSFAGIQNTDVGIDSIINDFAPVM